MQWRCLPPGEILTLSGSLLWKLLSVQETETAAITLTTLVSCAFPGPSP